MLWTPLLLSLSLALQQPATGVARKQDYWNASEYAKHSVAQQTYAQSFFWYYPLQGNEKILDLGCGDGKITARIAARVPKGQVWGIDNSPSMVEYAIRNFGGKKHANLQFQLGNVQDFQLAQKFDYILSFTVMQWVPDMRSCLERIRGHLSEKGRVYMVIPGSKEGLPFDAALKETVRHWADAFVGFEEGMYFRDLETCRKDVAASGLHLESLTYSYKEIPHDTKEAFLLWVRQWLPHVRFLPEEKQQDFLEELYANYFKCGGRQNKEGKIVWEEYIISIHASAPRCQSIHD